MKAFKRYSARDERSAAYKDGYRYVVRTRQKVGPGYTDEAWAFHEILEKGQVAARLILVERLENLGGGAVGYVAEMDHYGRLSPVFKIPEDLRVAFE